MAVLANRLGEQATEIMKNRDRLTQLPELGPRIGIHFVGIGGIGMSGLARICLDKGCRVTGTDLAENDQTSDLRRRGATICIGETPELVLGSHIVVYSSAVPADHPERLRADSLDIHSIRRGTLLAHLTRHEKLLAVAGTHGKTTTSSMLALSLRSAGLDPTVVVGGVHPGDWGQRLPGNR